MSRFRIAQKITFLPWFDLRCSELHDMFKPEGENKQHFADISLQKTI